MNLLQLRSVILKACHYYPEDTPIFDSFSTVVEIELLPLQGGLWIKQSDLLPTPGERDAQTLARQKRGQAAETAAASPAISEAAPKSAKGKAAKVRSTTAQAQKHAQSARKKASLSRPPEHSSKCIHCHELQSRCECGA